MLIEETRMPDGCTIGLRVDVTEIKKKEEGFRLLFDDNPIPMFLFDGAARTILAVNNAACANYGYGEGELVGHSIEMIYDEEPRADGAPAERPMAPSQGGRQRHPCGDVSHAPCNTMAAPVFFSPPSTSPSAAAPKRALPTWRGTMR